MNSLITTIVAIVGAVTGVTGLLLGILNYQRDRASLRVSYATGLTVLGDPNLDRSRPWGRIEISHVGRRPIFFASAHLVLHSGKWALPPRQTSETLVEGSAPVSIYFDDSPGEERGDDPYICARAQDGHGCYHYSRMSLRHWMRMRWLIWRGVLSG